MTRSEDDELQTGFFGGFHRQSHRGDISEEAGPDVLNVEDKGVEAFELDGSGLAFLAPVEAVNLEAGPLIAAVLDGGLIGRPPNSVFGAEEGAQLHRFSSMQEVDGRGAIAGPDRCGS